VNVFMDKESATYAANDRLLFLASMRERMMAGSLPTIIRRLHGAAL